MTGATLQGSDWEPCHAVNLEEGRPADNPQHVCVLNIGHSGKHRDYNDVEWTEPGHPHVLVVP